MLLPNKVFGLHCDAPLHSVVIHRRASVAMLRHGLGSPEAVKMVRVRLKIIGNLETMHGSYLPTVLIISLPIIFKRTAGIRFDIRLLSRLLRL